MKQSASWSDEETVVLKDLWAQGKTAQQISDLMPGKSRSSVLSKARRENLPRRDDKPSRSAHGKIATVKKASAPKEKRYYPTAARLEVAGKAFGEKCSMAELRRGQCCWPVGDPKDADFGFCAAPARPGKNYCPAHHGIAFSKTMTDPKPGEDQSP